MKKHIVLMSLIVVAVFIFAACSPSPAAENSAAVQNTMSETNEADMASDENKSAMTDNAEEAMDDHQADGMSEEMSEEMAEDSDKMADEAMSSENDETSTGMEAEDMMTLPEWQTIQLTNARTGDTFTLSDFSGKTVFVEPMATWCTNCRRQLNNVRQAQGQFGEDVVFIALSLETNISDDVLASYAVNEGFDWTFAVMSPEILQSLTDTFGRSITSAPSTPHFVIRPDGTYTDLVTGIESPEEIAAQIQAAQG